MKLKSGDLLSDYFNVYLDGKKLNRCFMADEEKGICEVYRKFDKHVTVWGTFTTETLKGKVELKPKHKLNVFLKIFGD